MGKNSSNRKKKAMRRKLDTLPPKKSLSIDVLLSQAQEKMDAFQYEAAQKLCQEVLQKNSDHIVALETSGNLCIELKNLDGAKKCYGRAISLQPDEGYRKYLVMGQLMDGLESGQCYLKGIELMTASLNNLVPFNNEKKIEHEQLHSNGSIDSPELNNKENANNVSDEQSDSPLLSNSPSSSSTADKIKQTKASSPSLASSLKREISSAYCSLSELYMTDLCDGEDAETNCNKYSKLAIESDQSNPEAYQQMANFLLVKQDIDGAKNYMKQSIELWLPKYQSVVDDKAEGGTFDPIEVCPLSYETRLSSARLLIELEEHETALDVLESLIGEDDEVVDTWYLLGLNNYLSGEEQYDSARENFTKAIQLNEANPCSDESIILHINELMSEIGTSEELIDCDDNEDSNSLNLSSDEESMEFS